MKKKTAAVLLLLLLVLQTGCGREPIGSDPHTWRGYSSGFQLNPDIRVVYATERVETPEGECLSYGLYEEDTLCFLGRMILTPEQSARVSFPIDENLKVEDRDGDGENDIGIVLGDGTAVWFQIFGSGKQLPADFPQIKENGGNEP